MSQRLDEIKLNQLSAKSQVTLFNPEGYIIESCDTLLTTDKKTSIFEQFTFLLSIQEVIETLIINDPLTFEMVEWQEQVNGLFGLKFEKLDEQTFLWFIIDKTDEKEQILSVQQSRNNASIHEELLEIRQSYLESEKKLLSFRNDELLRIQKFKSLFFAEVSHEMRTPLNSITGLVKLIEWSEPSAIHEYLRALKATSEHLNHIINDVLDLSKIEEGKLQLEELSFNLRDIINTILKGFAMVVQEKGILLHSTIDEAIPSIIKTDPIRLSQVLYNIIGNAIKFTHKGEVTLRVSQSKVEAVHHLLKFEVEDSGIGMSEESIRKILEPYAQVAGQKAHEYGGTGLGMGIAQKLIQIMGGALSIESEMGKGTQMSFELSCSLGETIDYSLDDRLEPEFNVDASHLSFLFAEDDAMSTLIMKERSAQWNLNSHFVSDIVQLREELWEKNHDILITDLHLGEAVASELVIEFRQSDHANRQIPVIFLSGDNQSLHPELDAIDNWSYLVKPVSPKLLAEKIRELLNLDTIKTLPPVDLSYLQNTAQNNIPFVIELIDTLLEHLPLDMEKLAVAITNNDLESARKSLHKMKPSISYLGIPSLLDERNQLYDKVNQGVSIEKELTLFKSRLKMALEDLEAQKNTLVN